MYGEGVVDGEAEVVTDFSEGFGTDDDHVRFITVEFEEIGWSECIE